MTEMNRYVFFETFVQSDALATAQPVCKAGNVVAVAYCEKQDGRMGWHMLIEEIHGASERSVYHDVHFSKVRIPKKYEEALVIEGAEPTWEPR